MTVQRPTESEPNDSVERANETWGRLHLGYASSVMIAKNSCSLISPSWSRSNSSIIACL